MVNMIDSSTNLPKVYSVSLQRHFHSFSFLNFGLKFIEFICERQSLNLTRHVKQINRFIIF